MSDWIEREIVENELAKLRGISSAKAKIIADLVEYYCPKGIFTNDGEYLKKIIKDRESRIESLKKENELLVIHIKNVKRYLRQITAMKYNKYPNC